MTLTIKTKNKKKIAATKSFLTAMDIKFKDKAEKPYNPEFVEKILQGDVDFKNGKGIKMTIDELNALWK